LLQEKTKGKNRRGEGGGNVNKPTKKWGSVKWKKIGGKGGG